MSTQDLATQSISSLRSSLPAESWRTLLQTFRTKIFLALSDDFSARTASELCGKEEQLKPNYNIAENGQDAGVSVLTGRATSHRSTLSTSKGYSVQRDFTFEPKIFSELRNAQAIVLAYDGLNRRVRSWERLRLLLGCPGQDREQRRNKMNTVILIGYLGSDAESRTTRNNSTLTVLSLATNRVWKDRETGERQSQTTWHRCVTFGPTATYAATLAKGAHVQIEGEIQTREYVAKEGAKKFVTEVRLRSARQWHRFPSTTVRTDLLPGSLRASAQWDRVHPRDVDS